jgi:TnpA family transposase
MASYEFRFVGADRLPNKLSDFDIQQHFALSRDDVAAIKARFKADHRAGAAVLLLFLRASGRTLDRFSVLPRQLFRYIGEALSVQAPTIASLRTIYARRQTLYEHQLWLKEYLELNDIDDADVALLTTHLTEQAKDVVSLDELVICACRWLCQNKIIIPGNRQVRDVARKCFATVEAAILKTVKGVVSGTALEQCRRIAFGSYKEGAVSGLEWLKTPPKRHSPTTLSQTLEKIRFLKDLGVHQWNFDTIPLEKQRGFAQALRARRPVKSGQLKEALQTIELVFFLKITLLELTDSLIYLSGRRVSDLVRQAYDRTQARQAKASVQYRECILAIKALTEDASQSAESRLAAISKLITEVDPKTTNSHAATVRQTLTEDASRIRTLLSSLQDLDFKGRADDPGLSGFVALKQLYMDKRTALPLDQTFNVPRPWQALVDDPDRERGLKALEACTMVSLRKSLRRGSVWIDHSLSYRERDQMLIAPAEWQQQRGRYYALLGLPTDLNAFLDPLLANIKSGLAAVNEAHQQGKLSIDADGVLHLPALEASAKDIDPKRTRDLMFKQIGDVQFPDLMLETDAHTNFSELLLGRKARNEHELVALYAALIVHGTEIDAKGVAAMTPQLDPGHVSVAMRALETSGRLRRANERVVEFQIKHAIAACWGAGDRASSDMMSLDASKHLWNARVDPRRRTHAAGIYTHVLDQHGIIYDQPIVLNERQAGPAIEGVVRYNDALERVRLSLLAVDTHGYTNAGMAIAKFLGFDLCPQLRNLAERKLFLPRNIDVPEGLGQLIVSDVSLRAIRQGWDELVRHAASIFSGHVSANVAMQRFFGSAAQGDVVHRAADQLGRLLRTLFLCDYFSNRDFRREIHSILNRGESVHQLQRAIHYGRIAPERGRRGDEMIAISGSHTLLTNLVIAWNTHRMQETVDRWRRDGQNIKDEWLARMGPGHFAHINFRGTFRFGVQRYADVLLGDALRRREQAS